MGGYQSTAANVVSSGGTMPNRMLPLMGVGLLPTMLHLLLPKTLWTSTGVTVG